MTATVERGWRTRRLLPAALDAPRLARRTIARAGELAHYPDLRFAAQLLASELVANGVRHAGGVSDRHLVLTLECDEETLHVEVRDPGPGFDVLGRVGVHHLRGERVRGLVLLDALADRWGFRRGDGFVVWFELDLVPGRRPWRGREPVPRPVGATQRPPGTSESTSPAW